MPTPISHFVNLRKSETEREQLVLLAYRPSTREVESFAQSQHGFKSPDRPSCRAKGLKAANPWHGPLDPKVVTLDPLLQVLGDVMERLLRQEPLFSGRRDGRWVGPG